MHHPGMPYITNITLDTMQSCKLTTFMCKYKLSESLNSLSLKMFVSNLKVHIYYLSANQADELLQLNAIARAAPGLAVASFDLL